MVAVRHFVDVPEGPLDVATARARVDALRAGLPDTLLAARPEELRRLARAALDAERAASRRRAKVGDEPALDVVAADAALAAHAGVRAAREGLADTAAEGHRWLAIGNLWGVGGLGLATALIVNFHYEPMATPVYYAVAGGAAGPVATAGLALTRRSVAAMRLASSIAHWTEALRVTGSTTMGELWARRVSHRAWARRVEEADAATGVARAARGAWHRVVGPRRHPREAPAIIDQLARLRAAQLDLLEALLAERTRTLEAARTHMVSVAPVAMPWSTPGSPPETQPRRSLPLRFWRR